LLLASRCSAATCRRGASSIGDRLLALPFLGAIPWALRAGPPTRGLRDHLYRVASGPGASLFVIDTFTLDSVRFAFV
jgi:hypothetical protein